MFFSLTHMLYKKIYMTAEKIKGSILHIGEQH